MCGAIDKMLHGNKKVRYIATEHMEVRREAFQDRTAYKKVRPDTGREGGLGHVRRDR